MTTWYVRPDTTHSGTRNGTSYSTAWGGWSEITWGVGGVVGGDTLYVCGAHAYSSTISVGTHGGIAGSICTITGDYSADPGSIVFTGASILQNARAYTTIDNLPVTAGTSNAIFTTAAATNCRYINSTLTAGTGTSPIFSLNAADGQAHSTIEWSGNTFVGSASCQSGAISWLLTTAAATSTLSGMTIDGNTFRGFPHTSMEAVVRFRTVSTTNAASVMSNIVITDNTFDSYAGVAIRTEHGHDTIAIGTNLTITGNTMNNGSAGASSVGGAIMYKGFGGVILIEENTGDNLVGVYGGVNFFYSRGSVIQKNYFSNLSTPTIDGNGVLADIGNDGALIRWNTFEDFTGGPGNGFTTVSGCGLMLLASTNVLMYGNKGIRLHYGIHFGDDGAGQSGIMSNNTFLDIDAYGLHVHNLASRANCKAYNNILTFLAGATTTAILDDTAGGWTEENNNSFYGYTTLADNHTPGASSITTAPQVRSNYSIPSTSPCKGTGTFKGHFQDWYGKRYNLAAIDMGAVAYSTAPTITTRTITTRTVTTRETTTRRKVAG